MNRRNLKTLARALPGVAWLASIAAMAFAAALWGRLDRLERLANELTEVFVEIELAVGYSGFIHNFKNLILRPDEPHYYMEAVQNYLALDTQLNRLSEIAAAQDVEIDLSNFRDTMATYRRNLDVVRAGQAAGLGPEEVDASVRIPDWAASVDMRHLQRELSAILGARETALQHGLMGALGGLILSMTAAAVSAFYARHVHARLDHARQSDLLQQARAHARQQSDLAAELARINKEQAEFTYAISHDLKSPTNTASMLANALAEDLAGRLDEDTALMLADLEDVTSRMGRLIEDTLTYSMALGTFAPRSEVDLDAVLDDVLSDLRAAIDAAGARVERVPLPQLVADSAQMYRLLLNLVGNALKYRMPDRDPVIRIAPVPAPPGEVAFAVADNGIGIPQEHHERIFRLFARLHTAEGSPGSGLGLAVCNRIATAHGGRIDLTSSEDEGAVFTVILRTEPFGRSLPAAPEAA